MNQVTATANNSDYLSKGELINWINDTLKVKYQIVKLNISRIESLGTGAIHC